MNSQLFKNFIIINVVSSKEKKNSIGKTKLFLIKLECSKTYRKPSDRLISPDRNSTTHSSHSLHISLPSFSPLVYIDDQPREPNMERELYTPLYCFDCVCKYSYNDSLDCKAHGM